MKASSTEVDHLRFVSLDPKYRLRISKQRIECTHPERQLATWKGYLIVAHDGRKVSVLRCNEELARGRLPPKPLRSVECGEDIIGLEIDEDGELMVYTKSNIMTADLPKWLRGEGKPGTESVSVPIRKVSGGHVLSEDRKLYRRGAYEESLCDGVVDIDEKLIMYDTKVDNNGVTVELSIPSGYNPVSIHSIDEHLFAVGISDGDDNQLVLFDKDSTPIHLGNSNTAFGPGRYHVERVGRWGSQLGSLLFIAHSASIEVTMVAKMDDGKWHNIIFSQDDYTAQLPMSSIDGEDTNAVSLALDLTNPSVFRLASDESEDGIPLPPSPVLYILSTDAIIAPYRIVNTACLTDAVEGLEVLREDYIKVVDDILEDKESEEKQEKAQELSEDSTKESSKHNGDSEQADIEPEDSGIELSDSEWKGRQDQPSVLIKNDSKEAENEESAGTDKSEHDSNVKLPESANEKQESEKMSAAEKCGKSEKDSDAQDEVIESTNKEPQKESTVKELNTTAPKPIEYAKPLFSLGFTQLQGQGLSPLLKPESPVAPDKLKDSTSDAIVQTATPKLPECSRGEKLNVPEAKPSSAKSVNVELSKEKELSTKDYKDFSPQQNTLMKAFVDMHKQHQHNLTSIGSAITAITAVTSELQHLKIDALRTQQQYEQSREQVSRVHSLLADLECMKSRVQVMRCEHEEAKSIAKHVEASNKVLSQSCEAVAEKAQVFLDFALSPNASNKAGRILGEVALTEVERFGEDFARLCLAEKQKASKKPERQPERQPKRQPSSPSLQDLKMALGRRRVDLRKLPLSTAQSPALPPATPTKVSVSFNFAVPSLSDQRVDVASVQKSPQVLNLAAPSDPTLVFDFDQSSDAKSFMSESRSPREDALIPKSPIEGSLMSSEVKGKEPELQEPFKFSFSGLQTEQPKLVQEESAKSVYIEPASDTNFEKPKEEAKPAESLSKSPFFALLAPKTEQVQVLEPEAKPATQEPSGLAIDFGLGSRPTTSTTQPMKNVFGGPMPDPVKIEPSSSITTAMPPPIAPSVLGSGFQSTGLFGNTQSTGLFGNTQSTGPFSNTQSTGLFSNTQSTGPFSNTQGTTQPPFSAFATSPDTSPLGTPSKPAGTGSSMPAVFGQTSAFGSSLSVPPPPSRSIPPPNNNGAFGGFAQGSTGFAALSGPCPFGTAQSGNVKPEEPTKKALPPSFTQFRG